jgi:hypothetical protein
MPVSTAIPFGHDIDRRNRSSRNRRGAKGYEKGPRWRTWRARCAREGQVGQEGRTVKKMPKAAKDAGSAREGSKAAKILDLLKWPGGATTKELMKATDWQPHSVRGFLSGTIGKKMGLTIASIKGEDGERSYSIKA